MSSSSGLSKEEELYEKRLRDFNKVLVETTTQLVQKFPKLAKPAEQVMQLCDAKHPSGYSTSEQGAKKAWPFFDEFRDQLPPKVATPNPAVWKEEDAKDPLMGEPMILMWNQLNPDEQLFIWESMEDMAKLLDRLHKFLAKPDTKTPDTIATATASTPESTVSAPAPTTATASATATATAPTNPMSASERARLAALSERLSNLGGNANAPMRGELNQILNQLNEDAKDGKTPKEVDTKTLSSVVVNMIDKQLEPLGGLNEDDDDDDENDPEMQLRRKMGGGNIQLTHFEKQEREARKQMKAQEIARTTKRNLDGLINPDSFPKEDMEEGERKIREREERRAMERKNNPKHQSQSDFSLCAHFNRRCLEVANIVAILRCEWKLPNTETIAFPSLEPMALQIEQYLAENPGTDEFIKPISAWLSTHQANMQTQPAARAVLMQATEPFLVEHKAKFLILTFTPAEWTTFLRMESVQKMISLAMMYATVSKQGMDEFLDFVNDMLADCGFSASNPKQKINKKRLRQVIVDRLHPAEVQRFGHLFTKKGKSNEDAMFDMVESLIPMLEQRATGFGSGSGSSLGSGLPISTTAPVPAPVTTPAPSVQSSLISNTNVSSSNTTANITSKSNGSIESATTISDQS